jgi:hypothetical protein
MQLSIFRLAHYSRLDKAPWQSQSSTSALMQTHPHFSRTLIGVAIAITAVIYAGDAAKAQAPPPPDAPDVVDYTKLLPLLPEALPDWTADKPDGSTSDVGGFKLTNVHRDYRKGEADDAPSVSISILDSVSNPDYVIATTAAWDFNSQTAEGYTKSVTIDGNPGFEAYEIEGKHASLWVMVAKRYFVQIEIQKQDPKELQEWIKKVDLKKLAAIK